MTDVVDLAAALETVDRPWSPLTVATLNDYDVRVVRTSGEFTRHTHPETDELFLVLRGSLTVRHDDRDVHLGPGQLHVVPRGEPHQPLCPEGAEVLLVEPSTTVNTGDSPGSLTAGRRTLVAGDEDRADDAPADGGPADDLVVHPLPPSRAGEALTLQRAAYVSEAVVYGDPAIVPLRETLAEVQDALTSSLALGASRSGRLVGVVRGRVAGDVLCVGRLGVAPDQQGLGVGSTLLRAVENAAPPPVTGSALFTGERSEGNLRLYARHGYTETHRTVADDGVTLVHLAKDLRR